MPGIRFAVDIAIAVAALGAPAGAPAPKSPPAKVAIAWVDFDCSEEPLRCRALRAGIDDALAMDSALAPVPEGRLARWIEDGKALLPGAGSEAYRALAARLAPAGGSPPWLALAAPGRPGFDYQRIWWMPWLARAVFRQDARLRLADGATGEIRFAGRVPAEWEWARMPVGLRTWSWGDLDPRLRDSVSERLRGALARALCDTVARVAVGRVFPKPEPPGKKAKANGTAPATASAPAATDSAAATSAPAATLAPAATP